MRALRLGIKPHVRQELKQLAKDFKFADVGFVEDLFALVRYKGGGIPTATRIVKMVDVISKATGASNVFTGIMLRKRVQVLRDVASLAYFKTAAISYDPLLAVQKIVGTMIMSSTKKRQSTCKTCALLSKCQWGKEYGEAALNSCKIEDSEWETKINPACPERPEIEGFNSFTQGLKTIKQILTSPAPVHALAGTPKSVAEDIDDDIDEDMDDEMDDDSFGKGGASNGSMPNDEADEEVELDDFIVQADPNEELTKESTEDRSLDPTSKGYGATHSGVAKCRVFENFVDKLSLQQMVVFDLGAKFSLLLGKNSSRSFKPVQEVSADRKDAQMETMSDIRNLTPSSHGLPEEVFDAKLDRKQLNKNQNLTLKSRKQLLYLLIDNSASMSTGVNGQPHAILTRGALAGSLAMAVTKKVIEDGGIVFVRFFAYDVSRLFSARTKQEGEILLQTIALCDYNGAGTNLTKALSAADSDIKNASDELARSEILMVTDAEDEVNPRQLQSLLGSREFNVLDVAGSNMKTSSLKNLATKYYKANEKELNLEKMVQLL